MCLQRDAGSSLIVQVVAAKVPHVEKHVGPHNQPQLCSRDRVDDLQKLYKKLGTKRYKNIIYPHGECFDANDPANATGWRLLLSPLGVLLPASCHSLVYHVL